MAKSDGRFAEKLKALWPYLLVALVGLSAYFLTRLAIPEGKSITRDEGGIPRQASHPQQEEPVKHRKNERGKSGALDLSAIDNGAIPNQRIVVFKNQAALDAFLAGMGDGVSVLGRLDRMNALLVGFGNGADLTALLDGTEETGFNFPASIPEFESVGAQDGAVAFGSDLMKWLGLEGDNSLWGLGVKIAVLDTGIADHLVFKNAIQRINLVALPSDLEDLNGHGTAVASLIFSNNPFAPGVAPGATPISIRIADDNGSSSSFLLAQGVYAALDAGAGIINISLGGQGKSAFLDAALAEASRLGVPVIVSAGNTGREGVLEPAANASTIAVGAVDRNNQSMAFSTTGPEVNVSAPGFGINVAYPGDKAAQVSGTSPAAPIITGLIAGISSNGTGTPKPLVQSANLVMNNLNDIGTLGKDNQSGGGVPNLGTILYPQSYDASVNSITVTTGKNGSQAQVMVQNVGTQRLVNTGVSVNVNGVSTNANITTLAPMESRVISIPVPASGSLNIQGRVQVSGTQTDQRPSNDSISQSVPAPSP